MRKNEKIKCSECNENAVIIENKIYYNETLVMLMSLSGCMKDYDFNPATTVVRMMIQGSE